MNVREPRSRQHLLDEAENVVGVLPFHSRVLLDVLEQLVGSALILSCSISDSIKVLNYGVKAESEA